MTDGATLSPRTVGANIGACQHIVSMREQPKMVRPNTVTLPAHMIDLAVVWDCPDKGGIDKAMGGDELSAEPEEPIAVALGSRPQPAATGTLDLLPESRWHLGLAPQRFTVVFDHLD